MFPPSLIIEVPQYPDYTFWQVLRSEFTGASPGELFTDLCDLVLSTLREDPLLIKPTHLYVQNDHDQALYVLGRKLFKKPTVRLLYLPTADGCPEHVNISVAPPDDMGVAYLSKLSASLSSIGDYDYRIRRNALVIRSAPTTLSASSGYPSGTGLDDAENGPEEHADDIDAPFDDDSLGDHIGDGGETN